ncbi:MAG: acyl-phosphate glycerol 3-phosphate acyltransferase [Omnitrophica bacterium RIFCSPHIGHO2_02_FULL_63_14]|nr:MAG: acyl-phosphate glycerol 3-phosphate acyltransferase [Omnitrophica bacterium RIFCSPHIGHO2_02_FULL_63_14]
MTLGLLFFVLAFAAGSVPTAYWITRRKAGVDIRAVGSGNVGATNAARVLGRKWGVTIFAIDFAKGLVPTLLYLAAANRGGAEFDSALWVGSGAVIGHVYSPFLNFRGGKGIAAGAGVIAAVFPQLLLAALGVWGVVFFLTKRTVSIASMAALAGLAVLSWAWQMRPATQVFFLLLAAFGFWTHRANIRRILRKEEGPLAEPKSR